MLSRASSWAASASSRASSVSMAVSSVSTTTLAGGQRSALHRRHTLPMVDGPVKTVVRATAKVAEAATATWASRAASSGRAARGSAWLFASFLAVSDEYQRIATATPRLTVAVLGFHLADDLINTRPALASPADLAFVHREHRKHREHPGPQPDHMEVDSVAPAAAAAAVFAGIRPKLATWPPTEKDIVCNKQW